jgi:hypothetical protein
MSIDVLTAHINTHAYVQLLDNFTKLKDGAQYSQLSILEQSREQILMCIKVILEINLRIRSLIIKVQGLNRSQLAQVTPPILIMHNELETAAVKFFSQHCIDPRIIGRSSYKCCFNEMPIQKN